MKFKCLFPLYSSAGWEFTTVEGAGNKLDGINQIQKRLADNNGSQCGYCSPGFVMSMYSLLKANPKPTELQIENSLDGNICRCTGYRAIMQSMKSFANDPIDIEDLSKIKCLNLGQCCSDNSELIHIKRFGKDLYQPLTLDKLNHVVKEIGERRFKYLAANTSKGVYKSEDESIECFINLQSVGELNEIQIESNRIELGAALTIRKMIELFKKVAKGNPDNFSHLEALASHLEKVGSNQLRNIATWAGNVWLKKTNNDFSSDLLIVLELARAKLVLFDSVDNKRLDPVDILKYLSDPFENRRAIIIQKVIFPALDSSKHFTRTYKCMRRPQNCAAYVSAGFLIDESTGKSTIIVNGIDSNFFHAIKTESFLNANSSSIASIRESIKILAQELKESGLFEEQSSRNPLLASPKYRFNLVVGLFYKFSLRFLEKHNEPIDESIRSAIDSLVDDRKTKVSKAEHDFAENEKIFPVNKSMPKLNAYSQTSGETKYVNDTMILNQLHGAFILAKYGNATIDEINVDKAMSLSGVKRVILAKDIPGKNNFMHAPYGDERLFCDGQVEFAGQQVGLVVADSYELAQEAAKMVEITYKDIRKPIVTIDDAIEQKSFHAPKPDFILGDARAAIQAAPNKLSGEINLDGSQFQFYLEGICATSEPSEDGFKVECSTQWVESAIQAMRNVLGPKYTTSSIDVTMKPVGGAFGGKISRANLVASAAVLASYHMNAPVKVNMDLNTTMVCDLSFQKLNDKYYAIIIDDLFKKKDNV